MTATAGAALVAIDQAIRKELQTSAHRPLVLGLCGAQGSGKSTLAAKLEQKLDAVGIACVILSLDDLYKTKAARRVSGGPSRSERRWPSRQMLGLVERYVASQLCVQQPGGTPVNDTEFGRFVRYYERLTRHILTDMPFYADIVIALDADRTVRDIRRRAPTTPP